MDAVKTAVETTVETAADAQKRERGKEGRPVVAICRCGTRQFSSTTGLTSHHFALCTPSGGSPVVLPGRCHEVGHCGWQRGCDLAKPAACEYALSQRGIHAVGVPERLRGHVSGIARLALNLHTSGGRGVGPRLECSICVHVFCVCIYGRFGAQCLHTCVLPMPLQEAECSNCIYVFCLRLCGRLGCSVCACVPPMPSRETGVSASISAKDRRMLMSDSTTFATHVDKHTSWSVTVQIASTRCK